MNLSRNVIPLRFTSKSKSDILRSKLLYRARQRGFLELDVLLGNYAEKRLPSMSEEELREMSQICDKETPSLFKQLMGLQTVDEDLKINVVFSDIINYWKEHSVLHG